MPGFGLVGETKDNIPQNDGPKQAEPIIPMKKTLPVSALLVRTTPIPLLFKKGCP